MLGTAALIATGALMMMSPLNTDQHTVNLDPIPIEISTESDGGVEVASYPVTVNTSFDKLDDIQAEAEAAGMSFRYYVRGLTKKKLVIDMVIETGDDYDMERIVITEADGVKNLEWAVDANGQATAFIPEADASNLTENRK